MKISPEILAALMTFVFLVLGSISHANNSLQNAKQNGDPFTKADWITFFIYGALGGLIFGQLAQFFVENQYIINAATGVGAFLGFKGLVFAGELISSMFSGFFASFNKKKND